MVSVCATHCQWIGIYIAWNIFTGFFVNSQKDNRDMDEVQETPEQNFLKWSRMSESKDSRKEPSTDIEESFDFAYVRRVKSADKMEANSKEVFKNRAIDNTPDKNDRNMTETSYVSHMMFPRMDNFLLGHNEIYNPFYFPAISSSWPNEGRTAALALLFVVPSILLELAAIGALTVLSPFISFAFSVASYLAFNTFF